jgi:DNA-binding response OmpR family regulator
MSRMQRILIVEDEKPLREAFTYLLKSEGFEVDWAENGRLALAKLSSFEPDLILLDMLMPVMDGMSFLKEAHLPAEHPQVKTLMLSNLSDAITFDDAHEYGVAGSVLKADLSPMQLVEVVKKTLSNSK